MKLLRRQRVGVVGVVGGVVGRLRVRREDAVAGFAEDGFDFEFGALQKKFLNKDGGGFL
jgi:hypothetical protein